MDELWKDIEGYEGLYQVSTLGRVKSLDMKIEFYPMERKAYTQIRKGKILKPYLNQSGCMVVKLYKNGESRPKKVHRLVAITFLKNTLNYKMVRFKDGDKTNAKLENLKWG